MSLLRRCRCTATNIVAEASRPRSHATVMAGTGAGAWMEDASVSVMRVIVRPNSALAASIAATLVSNPSMYPGLSSLRASSGHGDVLWQRHTRRMSSSRHLPLKDCNSLGEMIQMAHEHLDTLSARNISAFWTEVSKSLQRRSVRSLDDNPNAAARQLDDILCHTLEGIMTNAESLSPRDLAQTAFALVKLMQSIEDRRGRLRKGSPHQILHDVLIGHNSQNKQFILRELTVAAMPMREEFDPRHLSNLIYAFGLTDHVLKFDDGRTSFDILGDVALSKLENFNEQDLSNMLWAYGNVKASNPRLFRAAGDKVASRDSLESFSEQALANIVWAYATLDETHPSLFGRIADHIMSIDSLGSFRPQALSNIVWAYATLEEPHPALFQKVADHILSLGSLDAFKPQELANVIWAYATLDVAYPALFRKVAGHIMSLGSLNAFKPQELSSTLWAYTTTKEAHPALFQKVANHIMSLDSLGSFNPQNLSNIVWACATAKESHPAVFGRIADHIVSIDSLKSFDAQALANIVWAYTTAGEPHPKLYKRIADHIMSLGRLDAFNPQNLANTVWAFASAKESHPALFRKVADHIIALDSLRAFNPQNLSNIVWAHATAKEAHPALFQKVAAAAMEKQKELIPQQVANLLWAYATHGEIDQHLFKSFAPTAAALLGKLNEQDVANIAWAYAVADVAAPSLFNEDFINSCQEKDGTFTVENLSQLHQWNLWQEELKSDLRMPPSLQQKCYNAFISQGASPSGLQDDVISVLSSIGLQLEEEVLTEKGYSLDAVVEVKGSKMMGVEVDGPTHFVGRKPTGSTILKHRQVVALEGIPLVSVPYWEWNKLGKTSKNREKKQQYLRALLG